MNTYDSSVQFACLGHRSMRATQRTVSRFEKLKTRFGLRVAPSIAFRMVFLDPGFGISLRTLVDVRLGDSVIDFSFMCIGPLWAAAHSQLTTLVSIDDVIDALPIRS